MQAKVAEMTRLAADGMAANEIARKLGVNSDTVMRAVRRTIPGAFRRGPAAFVPAEGAVARHMPHNVGYSTGLPTHHAVSLPRLRFLEN